MTITNPFTNVTIRPRPGMSRTWQRRIGTAKSRARTIWMAGLTVAVLACLPAVFDVYFADHHPDELDVAKIASQVDNRAMAAGGLAREFVQAFLTTPLEQRSTLRHFLTFNDPAAAPPAGGTQSAGATKSPQSPPPAVVDHAVVWSVIPAGSVGDAALYGTVIMVVQRPYTSADAVTAFYRVPVSIYSAQPRAMAWPAAASDPGPGADIKLSYDHPVPAGGAMSSVISGFITQLLTSNSGLDRYVLADSGLRPIGGYPSATVTSATASSEVPDNAAPGTQIHVRAIVSAQTTQFATVPLTYFLTLENSGGTWMVAAIDLIPQVDAESGAESAGSTHQ